jgi:hypothetical protein
MTPGRLVRLDAYNGGTASSTITLSCSGQPTVSAILAASQLATLTTNWVGTCSAVTIDSTNGWDTNFDNLVISSGVAPTSTPRPTSTPTSTPTAGGAAQTLTFDDLAPPGRPLNGQYPTNVADWGTNTWYLSRPWGQFTTNSVSFNGPSSTSAVVMFLSPRRPVRLDAYNGGSATATVTLACAGLPTVTATLAANTIQTISTGWTGACTGLTVSSSNGWFTNFDNIVVQ